MSFPKLKKKSKSKTESLDTNSAVGYHIKSAGDLPKFHKAIWQEDFTKVSQLIKKHDVNARDKEQRTPLHLAAAKASDSIIKLLCHYNPNVNAQDKDMKTPLVRASETGSSNAVNFLLQAKANPNISSFDGQSPIHISSHLNDERSVKLLLDHHANINTPNALGHTPLHIAAQAGHANLVTLFTNEGCDINALCGESQTPLMSAAEYGRLQVVKCLLELKADTECKNQRGWKAIDLAQVNGHNHCKIIIEDFVKRSKPKISIPSAIKPSIFSEKNSFGVPAHDKEVVHYSDISDEISARDIHTYSEDDTISYEPSEVQLNKPKISLSGALAKPVGLSELAPPPVDRTIDSDNDELDIESDSTSASPFQSIQPVPLQRISPLCSSPAGSSGKDTLDLDQADDKPIQPSISSIELEDTSLDFPVSNQSSNQPQATVSSEPAIIEIPADELYSDSSNTSISENNLYIPKLSTDSTQVPPLSVLSPLADVTLPVSDLHTKPRSIPFELDIQIEEPDRDLNIDALSPQPISTSKPVTDGLDIPEQSLQSEPERPLLDLPPLILSADKTDTSVKVIKQGDNTNAMKPPIKDSSSSCFDSDEEVPINASGNLGRIYDAIQSNDSDASQPSIQNTTIPVPEPIVLPQYDSSDEESLDMSTQPAEHVQVLSSTPQPTSRSGIHISEGDVSVLSDPNKHLASGDDDPILNPEPGKIDDSSLNTVLKSVSMFEGLTHIPESITAIPEHINPQIATPHISAKLDIIQTEAQPPIAGEITAGGGEPISTPAQQLNPYLPVSTEVLGELQLEESVSELSSSDEPPLSARPPPLLHALSPSRSKSFTSFLKPIALSTDDPIKNISQSDLNELSTTIPLNPIQLSESKSIFTLTQQMSTIQKEKEELENKLRISDTNCSKLNSTVEDLKASLSDLQQERIQLVDAQNQAELTMRKLQFEVQQRSSLKLEENEMLKQLNEKALKLEFQLVKETESHTNEEVKRKELELQLHLSQTTGTQLANRIKELDTQLTQERDSIKLLKQDYTTVSSNYGTIKKANESLLHEKDSNNTEIEKLFTTLSTCNTEIEKLRTEQSRATEEIRIKESKLESLQQSLYEHNEQANITLQQRVEEIRILEKRSSDDKGALEMQMVSLNAEKNLLQADLTRANDSIAVLEKDIHGLSEKLVQSTAEIDHLRQNNIMSQKSNDNVLTAHQTEKELLEREMLHLNDQIKYQQSKMDTLEQQLNDKANELKHSQSILTERGNLVTILQRDIDRNSMLLSSTGDKLKIEETNNAKLVKQLEQSSSMLENSKDEAKQLAIELERVNTKLTDNQTHSQELESKHITESLSVQNMISEHRSTAQGERQTLLQEISGLKQNISLLQEQLTDSHNKCEEYHREIIANKKEYSHLIETHNAEQHSNKELQEQNKFLEEEFHRATTEKANQQHIASQLEVDKVSLAGELENTQTAYRELNLKVQEYANDANVIAKAKESVEIMLHSIETERNDLRTNLDKQAFYNDSLKDQLTESRKSQTSSDALYIELTEKREALEEELRSLREEKNRAIMDATEAKLLWETEVKSRSKLGIKILEFEKDYGEAQALLKLEVDTKNKAFESIKDYERQIHYQNENKSRIEGHNKSLLTDIKSYKKRIKDFELREHRFPDLKTELSKERNTFDNALQSLNSQLSDSKELTASLKRDIAIMKEQLSSALRERDEICRELSHYKREINEEIRSYTQLKTEHKKLQDELIKWQQECSQKEKLYLMTKEKEMQNRKRFNQKLQEFNSHILEQSHHQDTRDSPGEIQLIKELERKTHQLESELSNYSKNSNVDDLLREDTNYIHKHYNSSSSHEDSTNRSRYRNPNYTRDDTYKSNTKRFSLPQVAAITDESDLYLHPSYVPSRPYTPNLRTSRASKWMDALDAKIANQLNLSEGIRQDISSYTPHISKDPHLSSIFHNYEV
ncbi:Calponin homology domain-containing protein [Oopsacas minuta]|uniref:Calponin homology domain-containing protein n=1 Tax=Oopsacas minuta TaxID=111878 RepID=A0AAV7KI05_9METZ|nr:Calponin homology domain-containing protein [Oopsacas minuta]